MAGLADWPGVTASMSTVTVGFDDTARVRVPSWRLAGSCGRFQRAHRTALCCAQTLPTGPRARSPAARRERAPYSQEVLAGMEAIGCAVH